MTSKNLFFKLVKQDFQKRIWCPIVIFIVYFLALEVRMLMMFGDLEGRLENLGTTLAEYMELRFFGTNIRWMAILVCFAAVLCAISGFSYLHAKAQLDTYHSLPVNRTQFFFAKYISGVMQFFFPFVLHIVVCLGIAAGKSAFSAGVFVSAIETLGVSVLVFLLVYAVFIMAVCLTGNLIVSIFGGIVLFSYSTMVSMLAYYMFDRFFDTYLVIGDGSDIFFGHFGFSPLSMLYNLFVPYSTTYADDRYFRYRADYLWVIVVAVLVYTLIAFVLYWKRASEAAGKAIAFRWAEPIIKTLIVIPAAFYSGSFFSEIAARKYNQAWYLFGVVFGFIIIALLLEIIFRFDIKSAFCHKKQLLFNAACVSIIFVIFRYDVLGYDTYVPADTELTSCAVSIDNLMAIAPLKRMNQYSIIYTDSTEYRMEHVMIQGNPSVMELARKAAADGYRPESDWNETISNPEKEYRPITYGYNLKNGKSVYRQYYINIADAETKKLLADIFNDEGYKTGTNPMLNSGWEQEYKYLYCAGNMNSATLDVTPQFQSKLLETYREEYLQLDFDTVLNTYPVGAMVPETGEQYENISKNGRFSDNVVFNLGYNGCLIYPQFTKTIALLAENGFDIYETYSSDEIDHILITYLNEQVVYEDTNTYTTCEYIEIADIFDKEQKQQILDNILNTSMEWQLDSYTDFHDKHFEVNVYVTTKEKTIARKYHFQKDMVPQFIYELDKYQQVVAK